MPWFPGVPRRSQAGVHAVSKCMVPRQSSFVSKPRLCWGFHLHNVDAALPGQLALCPSAFQCGRSHRHDTNRGFYGLCKDKSTGSLHVDAPSRGDGDWRATCSKPNNSQTAESQLKSSNAAYMEGKRPHKHCSIRPGRICFSLCELSALLRWGKGFSLLRIGMGKTSNML